MKTLLISTSDIEGGAARSTYRLHQGLERIGVDSQLIVRAKSSDDRSVIGPKNKVEEQLGQLKTTLDNLPLQFYRKRDRTVFCLQWFPDGIVSKIAALNPDIINLHWIGYNHLNIESIPKLKKPIVWTLQDMWPFTGGCHYTENCDRYQDACGACPQLHSKKNYDLSRWVWQRKVKAWKNLNLTIVTPSLWLAKCASSSSLFQDLRIEVIPFCLDTEKYQPIDRQVARKLLKLPEDKQIVLFGAVSATSDRRKGFHLLQVALQSLSQAGWQDKLELVVFGASQPENPVSLGFKTHYLGKLSDDLSLTITYSAADVMIVPSIQEAFGQTATEALACRTPVIGFKSTGVEDIVEHQRNGYLAKAFESEDLARGIAWVLEDKERHEKLCDLARQKAEQEFNLELQARRYLSLYEDILNLDNCQSKIYP